MTNKSSTENPLDLANAALALAEELRRFEVLAGSAQKTPLNSQKNIERAARTLSEAAECQQRVSDLVQSFMSSLTSARQQNQETAEALQRCGEEIRQRAEARDQLIT